MVNLQSVLKAGKERCLVLLLRKHDGLGATSELASFKLRDFQEGGRGGHIPNLGYKVQAG